MNASMPHYLALAAVVALSLSAARPCSGQWLTRPFPSLPVPTSEDTAGSVGESIAGGLVLGGGGVLAGAFTGLALSSGCSSSDFCRWEAAFYGAAVGGTLGMATGVHLGNRRRGSFVLDCLAAAGVWGIGIGIASASHWNDTVTPIVFISIPVAQLATTITVERLTGQHSP